MPPRPARRGRGVTRYPIRSSVHNITKLSQWERLHRRGKNQLVFVMFTLVHPYSVLFSNSMQEFVRNSHRLKTTLVELSSHSEFQDVIFAIVDIDKAKVRMNVFVLDSSFLRKWLNKKALQKRQLSYVINPMPLWINSR